MQFTFSTGPLEELGARVAFLVVPARPYAEGEEGAATQRILRRTRDAHGSLDALAESPVRALYRAFYAAMNVKPSAVSTPVKQASRILKTGNYRPIHPVVDTCMEIEYATLCSFQVYDTARLAPALAYTRAEGHEEVNGRAGLRPGELLLSDRYGVIHSPTLGNDTARLVSGTSEYAMVRVMGIPGMPAGVFEEATEEAAARLAAADIHLSGT